MGLEIAEYKLDAIRVLFVPEPRKQPPMMLKIAQSMDKILR
jgi:hypothetical protein